jgi:hypothetical protein
MTVVLHKRDERGSVGQTLPQITERHDGPRGLPTRIGAYPCEFLLGPFHLLATCLELGLRDRAVQTANQQVGVTLTREHGASLRLTLLPVDCRR